MRLSLLLLPFLSALCLAAPSIIPGSTRIAELDAFFKDATVTDLLTRRVLKLQDLKRTVRVWDNTARDYPGTFAAVLLRTLSKIPEEVKSKYSKSVKQSSELDFHFHHVITPIPEDKEGTFLRTDHSLLRTVEREVCPIALELIDPSFDQTLMKALNSMRYVSEPIKSVKVELLKTIKFFQADVLEIAHQLSVAPDTERWGLNEERFSFFLKLKQMAEEIGGYKDYPVLEDSRVRSDDDVKIRLEHLAKKVFKNLMERINKELRAQEFYPEKWIQTLKVMRTFRNDLNSIDAENHVSNTMDEHARLLTSLIESITPSLILQDKSSISALRKKDLALKKLLEETSKYAETIEQRKVSNSKAKENSEGAKNMLQETSKSAQTIEQRKVSNSNAEEIFEDANDRFYDGKLALI